MDITGLAAIVMVFGIPMSAIWTAHLRKMAELKLQVHQQTVNVASNELEALRQEVRALRETSMQYDLSFDTALQRMEQRVETLERRTIANTASVSSDVVNPPVINTPR